MSKKKNKTNLKREYEERIREIHKAASQSRPLLTDEVAAAFIAALRVEDWETLGETFGGRKIGAIYAYILDVLNEKIEESTAATIRVDLPLYEQCPTVFCKCGRKCEHGENRIEELEQKVSNKNKCFVELKEKIGGLFEGDTSPLAIIRKVHKIINLIDNQLGEVEE